MEPRPGNDVAANDQTAVPLADRVDQLEKNQATLIRLLTERAVLPHVAEEPARVSPGTTVASDEAKLAAAGAIGLALSA